MCDLWLLNSCDLCSSFVKQKKYLPPRNFMEGEISDVYRGFSLIPGVYEVLYNGS